VSLYNWGEPFLHPKLFEIIACAATTAHVHMDSNLSSRDFSRTFAKNIVTSGLTTLFASIDGVTQEVYEKYRVKGNVERVFRNLAAIQAAKAETGSTTPHLGWLYHVSRFNQDEMALAAERAKQMAIPIVFKRLSSPDPAWWSSFHFDSEMVLEGAEWFDQLYSPPRNPDLDVARLHKNVRDPCRQLYETMTIQWNGDVLPCTCVEGPDYTMGNVIRDSLEDVWNGVAFQKSRQFITNYGPVQGTGSVCETLECPVAQKHVD
jgi:radical SAM protein with 4Fe4S-binding SPASM domain